MNMWKRERGTGNREWRIAAAAAVPAHSPFPVPRCRRPGSGAP